MGNKGGKPGPAERFIILERRKNVAARYLRGEMQWEIARAFEVDAATISRDIKAIQEEWLAQAVANIGVVKARELAKIDRVERLATEAWERSLLDAQTLKARHRSQDGHATDDTEKTLKGQVGDPRFLEIMRKCGQDRCELLGLRKVNVAVTGKLVIGLVEVVKTNEQRTD